MHPIAHTQSRPVELLMKPFPAEPEIVTASKLQLQFLFVAINVKNYWLRVIFYLLYQVESKFS